MKISITGHSLYTDLLPGTDSRMSNLLQEEPLCAKSDLVTEGFTRQTQT